MLGFRKSASLLALGSALSACSHAGSITRISADYNRAMADVRNEQLLLNIMRAAAREPLQFSAMGEVAATVHRSVGIDTALNNIIAGGAGAITHTISLGANDEPVIKIAPLSNKEFIGGILRPTTPEALEQFADLGWDKEFVLPLVVAGYRCPGVDEIFQVNTGKSEPPPAGHLSGDQVRTQLVTSAPELKLRQENSGIAKEARLLVADDKALEMLRSGVAADYKIDTVTPGPKVGTSFVLIKTPASQAWTAPFSECPKVMTKGKATDATMRFEDNADDNDKDDEADNGKADKPGNAAELDEPKQGYIKLRSVEGVIYFLGERFRDCYLQKPDSGNCAIAYRKDGIDRILFLIHIGEAPAGAAAVATKFYDRHYWVSRLDPGDIDRTVKTFSFINQLIALQTEPSAISTTDTVLAIGGK